MKKILVVVDAQNDFIDGSLANPAAQERVPAIVNKIKNEKWDFIYATLDTHRDNYLETPEGKALPTEHCIEFTDGWKINKDVREALEYAKENGTDFNYVIKETFGSTVLAKDIERISILERNVSVELVGFCTDICVVSNALLLKAFCPNRADNRAEISVDSSCCAGTSEDRHNAALQVMNSCQILVK